MSKQSFTHYYVQAQEEGGLPEIVSHTYDKKTKEYFHKFLDRIQRRTLKEIDKADVLNGKSDEVEEIETVEEPVEELEQQEK